MGSNSGLPIFVHLLIGLFLPLPIPGDVLPSFAWIAPLVTQVGPEFLTKELLCLAGSSGRMWSGPHHFQMFAQPPGWNFDPSLI